MNRMVLDIETLPALGADPPAKLPKRPEPGKVPGNIRDEAKIQKRQIELADKHTRALLVWAQECDEARAEAFRMTSLDPWSGRVLCIGYAINDGEPQTQYADYWDGCDYDDVEEALMMWFVRMLKAERPNKWIGHGIGFDLTFLMARCWKYGLPISAIPWGKRATFEGGRIFDTYLHATAMGMRKGKLDQIARFLGVGGKPDGIDGSKVYDYWLAGKHDEIRAYCEGDVAMTRAVADRMGAM
jgi:hypothetical protein